MGFILFLVATIFSIVLAPVAIVYALIESFYNRGVAFSFKKIDQFFQAIALSIDMSGNVFARELFDDILIYPSDNKFGNPRETISSVLGKNERDGKLTFLGKGLAGLLNVIDTDHCKNSIRENIETERSGS